jgi:GDP-D-mannose dehydratase
VYGQVREDEIPIREDNPLRPASPYAVSKVGEDMLALQYWLSWKIKTIRTRMFTHTGPRRGEVFVVSSFAKQIASAEAGLTEPVVYVGNLDSVRTFADVRDAVRAYWLISEKCRPGEVYNIGGIETMTIGQMLDRLLEMSTLKDIKVQVDPGRLRPSDVTLQVPCIDKFHEATGWRPEIPFEKTLADTLEYWRTLLSKSSLSLQKA